MREQPAVIATPSTYPQLPASNATPVIIPVTGEAAAAKKCHHLCSEYQPMFRLLAILE
jgi:hypothetical protein